jgi:hypothetical protein
MSKAPIRNLKDLKYITIHHSAISIASQDMDTLRVRARAYDTQHSKKSYALETDGKFGYKWISYHYLLSAKGDILQVQDIKYMRNHAGDNANGTKSHNRYGIAICVDMNTTTHKISNSVKSAYINLIFNIQKQLDRELEIRTHREVSITPTSCAGDIMGTHTKGVCKDIIEGVKKLWNDYKNPKPPIETCEDKVKKLQATILEQEKVIDLYKDEVKNLRIKNAELELKIKEAIKVLQ